MSMDDAEDTYAPQSPDLSGYHSPHQSDSLSSTHYPYQQQSSYQDSYSQSMQHNQIQTLGNHLASQSLDLGSSRTRMPKHARTKTDDSDTEYAKGSRPRSTSRKGKNVKVEVACEKPAPGVEEGIEVKTKFPVARIKRIMQADEDVGKVAQTTPTAVSKALELFMISAVTRAAKEARVKSSKRVTNAHLKLSVEKEEQFDFLREVLAKIPDAPTVKKDDDSDETGDAKKKKGALKRRKKDVDDF